MRYSVILVQIRNFIIKIGNVRARHHVTRKWWVYYVFGIPDR